MTIGKVALLALFASAAVAVGKSEPTIAVVDMDRLMKAHTENGDAEVFLEEQSEAFDVEKKAMLAEYEELRAGYEAALGEVDNMALSEEGRQLKKEEARSKFAGVQEYERLAREKALLRQQQVTDQVKRLRRRVVDAVRAVIGDYAREKGLALVLDASNVGLGEVQGVVYSSDQVDVTEDILKLMEKAKDAGGR